MVTLLFSFTFHAPLTLDAAAALRAVTGMHIAHLDNPVKDTPGTGRLGEQVGIFLDRGDDDDDWAIEATVDDPRALDAPLVLAVRDNLRSLLKDFATNVREERSAALDAAEQRLPAPHFLRGKVKCYKSQKGHGFLTTNAGIELYFHKDVVGNALSMLKNGAAVEFTVRLGSEGPEAARVRVLSAGYFGGGTGDAAAAGGETYSLAASTNLGFTQSLAALGSTTLPRSGRNKSSH
jgi:cold shock CspA family protein